MGIIEAYTVISLALATLVVIEHFLFRMRTPSRLVESVTVSSFVDSKRMVRNDVVRTIARATGEVIEQRWLKTDTVKHAKYRELLDFIGDSQLVPREILNECYGIAR